MLWIRIKIQVINLRRKMQNIFQERLITPSKSASNISTPSSEEQEFSWELVKSKWETILPENELKVIRVLFNQGSRNQKSLAESIEVSTMTMSRIISRLETKRLVIRERTGMSNKIELKKEHLL